MTPDSKRAEMHERWCKTRPRATPEQERVLRTGALESLRIELVSARIEAEQAAFALISDPFDYVLTLRDEDARANLERLQRAITHMEALVG